VYLLEKRKLHECKSNGMVNANVSSYNGSMKKRIHTVLETNDPDE